MMMMIIISFGGSSEWCVYITQFELKDNDVKKTEHTHVERSVIKVKLTLYLVEIVNFA